MDTILNWLKDYFSNENNRSKVFNYIKTIFMYIKDKKLIKTAFLYLMIAFLFAISIIQLNIDVGYGMRGITNYITDAIGEGSIDLKRVLFSRVNKEAVINDNTNGVFMSDGFMIKNINNVFTASKLSDIAYNKNKKCIENSSWDAIDIDVEKCSNLLSLLKKNKTNCAIKTINKKDTQIWVNDCFMIKSMINEAIIDKNSAMLICGIKYNTYNYFFFLYIGEDYSKMQEFQNNVFVDKITPIFNFKNKDFANRIN